MSIDSGQGNSFCTPSRAQKCLFGSNDSSTKRRTCTNLKFVTRIDNSSSEDSDLGPMSPLALTDRSPSSCSSSSGRQFVSPLSTPETTSPVSRTCASWDRLMSTTRKSSSQSPFSSLRKLTRSTIYSPRKKLIPGSPPSKMLKSPKTPRKSEDTMVSDEIVPETPPRNFGREIQNGIVETPCKSDSPEHMLITPLTLDSKMIPLPKVHRRKSLSMLESVEGSSPERKENLLKRHALDGAGNIGAKLMKTDENSSIPKARAALFQDNESAIKMKRFTLSTKSFYSTCKKETDTEKESFKKFGGFRDTEQAKKRRSLPAQGTCNRRSLKANRLSGINAGVSHGIRRPKPKQNLDTTKSNLNESLQNESNIHETSPKVRNSKRKSEQLIPVERPPSPEIDPSKRFFKTNRTIKLNHTAIVTVNNKIKLKVANGKIALNPRPVKHVNKRPKLADISFDTADLSVDEPEVEASLEQDKVANILKVLEDDWADDDYDTMEPLRSQRFSHISPLKPTMILNDVTMSPASELSNMTSIMNIEDISAPVTFENLSFADNRNNNQDLKEVSDPKYFPLFTKGYNPSKVFEVNNSPKSPRGTKWQLSAKGGAAENQYQLDAGQKHFGATQCTECGVVYQLGDPEDENAHLNYHNSIKTLKFPGWKTERVVLEDPFTKSRIILVERDDPKQYWNKVSDILAVVDRDLGLADAKLSDYKNKKIYLYIRDKSVLGVLAAEGIETAHRMIPELLELDCCTAESTPAKCGINVVWTAMSHRRQGIARRLVDTLRTQFYYGYIMSLDDIAFSIPTPSGKIFAEKYTKTRNFKVYS